MVDASAQPAGGLAGVDYRRCAPLPDRREDRGRRAGPRRRSDRVRRRCDRGCVGRARDSLRDDRRTRRAVGPLSDSGASPRPLRVAVDIGGTFVDAMELDQRTQPVRFRKAVDHARRAVAGRARRARRPRLRPRRRSGSFIHGTTLGLNAVLERRGGATGIITNEGMRDIFLDRVAATSRRPHVRLHLRAAAAARGAAPHRRRARSARPSAAGRSSRSTTTGCSDAAAAHRRRARRAVHSGRASCTPTANPSHERRAAAIIREQHPGRHRLDVDRHRARVPRVRAHGHHRARRLHPADLRALRRPTSSAACGAAGSRGRFLIMRSRRRRR